jgi:hypothetical protein
MKFYEEHQSVEKCSDAKLHKVSLLRNLYWLLRISVRKIGGLKESFWYFGEDAMAFGGGEAARRALALSGARS